MIPQPIHPWLPQKMVWGGLPLVEELIWSVPDAPFAAEKLDAVLEDQLSTAHQLIVGLLFWTKLRLFLESDARVAAQHVETASFATGHSIKPVAHHAAVLPIAECNQELAAKSVPCLQRQGRCLMHPLMTYIHLCAP